MFVTRLRPRSTSEPLVSQRLRSSPSAALSTAAEHSTRLGFSLARSASRAASLTASPITVYSNRFSAPTKPANTGPADTPTPKSSSTCRCIAAPRSRAVARASEAAVSLGTGAPKIARAASPWNLLMNPFRLSTAATTVWKNELSTSATSSGGRFAASRVEPVRSMNRIATSRTSRYSDSSRSTRSRTTSSPTCRPNRSRSRSRSCSPVTMRLNPLCRRPISDRS